MLGLRTRPLAFLVEEALERDRVLGDLGAHHLERDVPIDELVPSRPHGAAGPRAEQPEETVTGLDQFAWMQRTVCKNSLGPGTSGKSSACLGQSRRRFGRPGRRSAGSDTQYRDREGADRGRSIRSLPVAGL